VVHHEEALIQPWRPWDGIVRASEGVPPATSHETLDLLREVRAGRVFVAKPRLSRATAEIAPWLDAGRRGGWPMVGVISETHASIGVAVRHTLPTGPPQRCPYHAVKDVAPPIGAADRHVTQELTQTIRGSRAIERHAATAPRQDAPRVADEGLAMRTVRRDEGQSPLEPPGVERDQPWPLLAASVERVMVGPPSARRHTLARRRAVLNVCHQADAPWVRRFRGVYQIAPLVTAHTRGEEAQAQLLTLGHALPHRGLPTAL
jgi:hypothetical protein